jgi:SAM-dependent methyltransferase
MGRMNETAARGFGAAAGEYERARPGYPAAPIDRAVAGLGLDEGARVVDLAAGTGKLTRVLAGRGFDLVAVEPVPAMRAQLVAAVPGVEVLDGTAEAMPFPDASLDAVFVAQAFHWFDAAAAARELHRVLRRGGGLAVVWNITAYDAGWLAALDAIYLRMRGEVASRRDGVWRREIDASGLFTPLETATAQNDERVTPEHAVERVASVSFVGALPDAERAVVLDEVRTLLATHPETRGRAKIVWTQTTEVHWCRAR